MAEPKVSVASLANPLKSGWLTKQGGSIRTWKRRWFVLKDNKLWYFKSPKDTEQTGYIEITENTVCQLEPTKNKAKHYHFSLSTPGAKRTYMIYSDSDGVASEWVSKAKECVDRIKNPPQPSQPVKPTTPVVNNPPPSDPTPKPKPEPVQKPATNNTAGGASVLPVDRLALAKGVIPFLQDDDSKVLEFWQIWSESIPPKEDLQVGFSIEYHVSTSANMQKLTWRTAGPQNIFIQKMVDFFWNVGAPESEIDRLNDVGALINPVKIGSWIDMSARGGMDGGWYFPVTVPLSLAVEAADPGDPTKKVVEWASKNGVEQCVSVGRDMGAAPPRQTEIRVQLPGATFEVQLEQALDAFTVFEFPSIPEDIMGTLQQSGQKGLYLSVITSSEGFVRLGVMAPTPTKEAVQALCTAVSAEYADLGNFEKALGVDGPSHVEYQYLKEGFGYGVYKEGFDVVFHYDAGKDSNE